MQLTSDGVVVLNITCTETIMLSPSHAFIQETGEDHTADIAFVGFPYSMFSFHCCCGHAALSCTVHVL